MNHVTNPLKSSATVWWERIAKLGIFPFLFACLSALPAAMLLGAQASKSPRAEQPGQFFIVASINVGKQQILLKQPTEVTEVAEVTEKTSYFDEAGKPIKLTDLRAGDTVYVTLQKGDGNSPVIARLQKGPMTPEELQRRYLNFK